MNEQRAALEKLYVKAVVYIATKSDPYASRGVLQLALEDLESAALEVLKTKSQKKRAKTN